VSAIPRQRGQLQQRKQERHEHLGDFTVGPRMLLVAMWALVVGALGALAAFLLLRLIGLVTNLVFYQRWDTALVAPGLVHRPWWLVLFAPVAGGLVIGLMARVGIITLPDLLHAGLHDLTEEHHRERLITGPARRRAAATTAVSAVPAPEEGTP
jgi:hypothetical protein